MSDRPHITVKNGTESDEVVVDYASGELIRVEYYADEENGPEPFWIATPKVK